MASRFALGPYLASIRSLDWAAQGTSQQAVSAQAMPACAT